MSNPEVRNFGSLLDYLDMALEGAALLVLPGRSRAFTSRNRSATGPG